jgi:hypothetical protein
VYRKVMAAVSFQNKKQMIKRPGCYMLYRPEKDR